MHELVLVVRHGGAGGLVPAADRPSFLVTAQELSSLIDPTIHRRMMMMSQRVAA